jgi:hypothetical protein
MTPDSKLVIKESILPTFLYFVAFISILLYGIFKQDTYAGAIGTPIYLFIFVSSFCFLAYKISNLIKGQPIMLINKNGIYHKDFKMMKWEQIFSIKTKDRMNENEPTVLLIQTSHNSKPNRIVLSDFDTSDDKIINFIQKFKNYNIYEVHDDEW